LEKKKKKKMKKKKKKELGDIRCGFSTSAAAQRDCSGPGEKRTLY